MTASAASKSPLPEINRKRAFHFIKHITNNFKPNQTTYQPHAASLPLTTLPASRPITAQRSALITSSLATLPAPCTSALSKILPQNCCHAANTPSGTEMKLLIASNTSASFTRDTLLRPEMHTGTHYHKVNPRNIKYGARSNMEHT